jgi:hypothetical protein
MQHAHGRPPQKGEPVVPTLVDAATLAALVGVSPSTVRSWVHQGVLVSYAKDSVAGRGATQQALFSDGSVLLAKLLTHLSATLGEKSPIPLALARALNPRDVAKMDARTMMRSAGTVELPGFRVTFPRELLEQLNAEVPESLNASARAAEAPTAALTN